MHRFYTPNIEGDVVVLSEEESAHAIRVLRLQKGEIILMLDGMGRAMQASIADAHPKKCSVMLNGVKQIEEAPKGNLHIAIAPTKNIDRIEWFVEKATEIGIRSITPIIASQSERRNLNAERLQKILVSAMKQSQRLYMPTLHSLTTYQKFIEESSSIQSQKFIAHCHENDKKLFSQEIDKSKDCIMLIGPEGDFNSQEIELALQNNFVPVSLGNARLRTETAALFATSIFNC